MLRPRSRSNIGIVKRPAISDRSSSDVRLHRGNVRGKHAVALRSVLDPRVSGRSRGLPAKRLAYCRGELGRQRGLDADQRNTLFALLEPDLDAVGGVRVDDDTIIVGYRLDRRD